MKSFRIPLRVVFYREDDRWVAHCLEFDLCGDGESQSKALLSLSDAIGIQLQESIEHKNLRNLLSPAPSDIQEKFFAGHHTAEGDLKLQIKSVDHVELGEPEYREYCEDDGLVGV